MLIYENETKALSYTYYDDNGDEVDIAAKTPYLYIYRDINSAAVASSTGTIGSGTGEFSFSVVASTDLSTLTLDRYYPYRVVLAEAGELSITVEEGILNYNKVYNPWEWDIDIYSGITLTNILDEAKSILRYDDWSDTKLTRFANRTLKDFSHKTLYVKGKVSSTTKYNTATYILPKLTLLVDSVYVDGVEKIKNRDWVQKDAAITFLNGSLDLVNGNIKGGQEVTINCSKYAQMLLTSTDYAELPMAAADVISDGIVMLARFEDRAPQDELTTAYAKYKAGVEFFTEKNIMDSLEKETWEFDSSFYKTANFKPF